MATWQQKLANDEIVVIDGAMGTELERRGVPMSERSWSGAALLEHPDAIAAVHEDYIRAGAEVIITNTFAIAPYVLEEAGLDDRFDKTVASAVELAQRAREACGADVAIAGSIANGAIRNRRRDPQDRLPPYAEMVANARRMAEALAEGGCDLIALEMMQDDRMAPAALEGVKAVGLPVWVGISAAWNEGRNGLVGCSFPDISFQSVIDSVLPLEPDVICVMHTDVDATGPALDQVRQSWNGLLGAYPNAGYYTPPHWNFIDAVSPERLVEEAQTWLGHDVVILGGCCGLGPEHIAALHAAAPLMTSRA